MTGRLPFIISLPLVFFALLFSEGLLSAKTLGLTVNPFVPAVSDLTGRLVPGKDKVFLLGHMDDPSFAVTSLDQVELKGQDGQSYPLVLESGSVVEELGDIVAFSFRAEVPGTLAGTGARFQMTWGPEIHGANQLEQDASLAPEAVMRVRRLIPAPAAAGGTQVAALEVVADSTADWLFLAYLLPPILVAVLAIRRRRAIAAEAGRGPV